MPSNISQNILLFYQLQVTVGENLVFPDNQSVGEPQWTVTYMFQSDTTSTLPIPVIAGSVGGVLIILIVIVVIVVLTVSLIAYQQAKKKDLRFTGLLAQMETMEMEMADQCKQGNKKCICFLLFHDLSSLLFPLAFAELQTDLGELVTDDALEGNQLPFHNFPTYATKVFFPTVGIDHPVLSPPRVR